MEDKVNKVWVRSFPRSGTHYMAALVSLNIHDQLPLDQERYIPKDVHELPSIADVDKNCIYIYRNADDVMKSLYNMRHQFGFKPELSLDEMTYGKMKDIVVDIHKERLPLNKFNFSSVGTGKRKYSPSEKDGADFRYVKRPWSYFYRRAKSLPELTLFEFREKHVHDWKRQVNKSDHMHSVSYDKIIEDEDYLLYFLNKVKQEAGGNPISIDNLQNVKKRVGFYR